MSYASDRGLTVGSKIKTLEDSDYFSINEILTIVNDDDGIMPDFRSDESGEVNPFCITRKWEHYKEEEKEVPKPKTPFEQAGFNTSMKFTYIGKDQEYFDTGSTVWITEDDDTECPEFTDGNSRTYLYVRDSRHGYCEIKPLVVRGTIKFPCCVPTQEIKDEETFKLILDLFKTSGATISESEFASVCSFKYFGVNQRNRTIFWDTALSYTDGVDVTLYSVTELLDMVNTGNSSVNSWVEWNNIDWHETDIDHSTSAPKEPVVTITQESTYTMNIKGTIITLTQSELNALAEDLLEFTTL